MRGEDWFFALVERSSDLIVVINAEGAVNYANPAALSMFGVSLEEAIGSAGFRYVHRDDLEGLMVQFADFTLSTGVSNTATVRFVSAS